MIDELIRGFDPESFIEVLRSKFSSFAEQDARRPTSDARLEGRAKKAIPQAHTPPQPGGLELMPPARKPPPGVARRASFTPPGVGSPHLYYPTPTQQEMTNGRHL